MPSGDVHLAIDYGTADTQAVLVWPDGGWEPVLFDGALVLSSAGHSTADGVLVGEAAWRHAATVADGFVPSPLSGLRGDGTGTVPVAGVEVPVADLAVATLRRVAAQAAERVGGPITDVRMVVPAEWGPRRRTWLRQVAYRAGLGQPRLVDAPVAAANRLLAVGVQVPVGAFLLICDLGAGCEVSVLRRGPAGFEVLSTLADPHAGASALDDRLTTVLGSGDLPDPAAGSRWALLGAVRAAREALSQQAVVTVPLPGPAAPVVLHSAVVAELAEPVFKQAGQLAAQAVTAAEITVDQLAGSYLIGGAAATPSAAQVISTQLGTAAVPVTQPAFAAVLGAADADATPAPGDTIVHPPSSGPPLRRLWSILIPGAASLLVYSHMVLTATFHNGNPRNSYFPDRRYYYVLTTWGELALAALLALTACLTAGSLFGDLLARIRHGDGTQTMAAEGPGVRLAGGIAVATAAGLAVSALYAVVAAYYFALPLSQPLRWALLPLLPAAGIAAVIAWQARRRTQIPRGWDQMAAFPLSAVLLTTAGMIMLAAWWHGPLPVVLSGWGEVIGRTGAMLIGAGIACTLTGHLAVRLALAAFLGVFGFFIAGGGDDILAVMFALAVAAWWGHRLWPLVRSPAGTAHAR